jgi:hypothetical protein
MRTFLFIATLIWGIPAQFFCQFNPSMNYYSSNKDTLPSNATQSNFSNVGGEGVACNPNSFFAVSPWQGSIDELTLVDNAVTFSSTLLASSNGANLAYSNNLNGGFFSPTFYSSRPGNISYFDGTDWVDIASGDVTLVNPGANGNYLYYSVAIDGEMPNTIIKYDGTNIDTIYVCPPNTKMCVADLAVDSFGNVVFVISTYVGFFDFESEKIVVISPSGEVLNEYTFVYDCSNVYGTFLLNGIYYLGFGPYNANIPNTLLPITFSGSSINVGMPIDMPLIEYYDLASCNTGAPLFLDYVDESNNNCSIYPNPMNSHVTINFAQWQTNATVRIINLFGKEIKAINFNGRELTIERGNIQPGIYFVQAIDEKKRVTSRKILVQ